MKKVQTHQQTLFCQATGYTPKRQGPGGEGG